MDRENARLKELKRLVDMETDGDHAFDDITRMATAICGTPIALISLVNDSKQWFLSRQGVSAQQTPREQAFCAVAIQDPMQSLIVSDASQDPRFAMNPLVTGDPHIRFYAGAPLVTSDGHALGTVCVIDTVPRELEARQLEDLRVLAQAVVARLEAKAAGNAPTSDAAMPTPTQRQAAYQTFRTELKDHGVRQSLAYLLSLTDYRFIGIWRFENGMANAAVHYDRENPLVLHAEEVPDTATYCCYVRDSKGAFTTAHALLDPRTEGHPAREVVAAYCGVPIMDPEGHIFGTLCHYDLVPRDAERIDLELMVQVAATLAHGGFVPPYPRP